MRAKHAKQHAQNNTQYCKKKTDNVNYWFNIKRVEYN